MKIHKDRYSHNSILALAGVAFIAYSFRIDEKRSATLLLIGVVLFMASLIYLTYLSCCGSGRLHGSHPDDATFKDENKDGFAALLDRNKLDGIKYAGRRYKLRNGTDVYFKNGEIKPCGPGAYLIQKFSKSGYEPQSIQGLPEWE